jgi:hypothetical protein
VAFHHFTKTKSNLMSLETWKNKLGRISICVIRTKEGRISNKIGMIRREVRWIKGRNDSSRLFLEKTLKHTSKDNHH